MARKLRLYLRLAGITRPELREGTPTSQPLTWHDLRATGATWLAVRGDDALKIMQQCGRTDYATRQRYVREAESLRDGFGEPFPPLPDPLLGNVTNRHSDSDGSGSQQKKSRLLYRRRDSNPPGIAGTDEIEAAVARALDAAASAGQWSLVAQLSRELEARRLERTGNP